MGMIKKTRDSIEIRAGWDEVMTYLVQPVSQPYSGADLLAMLILNKVPPSLRAETNQFPKRMIGLEGSEIVIRLEKE